MSVSHPIAQKRHTAGVPRSLPGHWWKKFIDWCGQQEENRMAWLAISLFIHGCILFPATVVVNAMAGNSIFFLIAAIISLMIMLVAHLSQLPERITIPLFFLSALIDLVIITICLAEGLHSSYMFQPN